MILDYFQLREQPFTSSPGAAAVYTSRTHSQLLASLSSSLLADRGTLALIADPGLGKSTLLPLLLDSLHQAGRAAFLFSSNCTSRDLLESLLGGLGIDSSSLDLPALRAKLNSIWFAELLSGKRFVLLFDDADHLSDEVLRTILLFSKCETSQSKFVQILLCGRPDFLEISKHDHWTKLHKRIAEVFRLEPLSPRETAAYVHLRVAAAGHFGPPLFDSQALALIALHSHGVPANINKICSRALLEAYGRGLRSVSADVVDTADRNLTLPASLPSATTASPEAPLASPPPSPKIPPTARRTWLTPPRRSSSHSQLWAFAIALVLLSAGLALPHGMLKAMTQIMHGRDTAAPESSSRSQAARLSTTSSTPSVTTHSPTAAQSKHSPSLDLLRPDASPPLPQSASFGQLSLTRELGLKISRIVIDPGHGGFDTGAKGPHGLLEKDLCLDVALRLGRLIKENLSDSQVIYTRTDDNYIPLEERTAIANGADADLFISIHANSSESTDVRGVETYYLSLATSKEAKELAIRENALTQSSLHDLPDLVRKITNNEKIAESRLLAASIQDSLSLGLQSISHREKNRGVKQAPFIVLAGADMPAVLSEISFLSNSTDESLLFESNQRDRIADGLFHGIASYLDGLRGLPPNKQKLFSESHPNSASTLPPASPQANRNPL